jgi:cell fate (sporulation/competence/biofilm development) regulator YlbF (YheA/YmcA/DUF963 family)
MNVEEQLAISLRESELVQRTKQWKRVIEAHPEYAERFRLLLEIQKKMVRADQTGRTRDYLLAKKEYEAGMAQLTGFPAVAEYLDCVEELQSLVEELQAILRVGLNETHR